MGNLNPILQMLAASKTTTTDYNSQIEDAIAENSAIGAREQTASAALLADTQAVEGQKNEGLLQAQREFRAVHDMRGGDPSDPSSRMAELILTHNEYTDKAIAIAKNIADKKSTGMLDNPVEWLINQITLPSDVSKYNALAKVANATESEIGSITADTTNAATAYKASAATLSAATNAASLDALAQVATINAGKMQQATLGHNVDFFKALQSSNQQELSNAFQLFGAQNSNEHLALQREQMEAVKEQRGWALAEREQKKEDLAQIAKIISIGMSAENKNAQPLSAEQIKFRRENGSAKQKADIERWYDNGLLRTATGRYNISPDPVTSAIIVAQNVNGLPPEMKSVEDAIKAVVSATKTEVYEKETGVTKLSPEQQRALLGNNLKAKAAGDAANVEIGGDGNIYSPLTLDKYLAAPTVANTKFAQTVIAQVVKAGQVNANVATVWAVADKMEAEGAITTEEKLQGMAEFYKSVRNINSGVRDYGRVAFPVQGTYNVVIPTSLSWGPKSEIPVDASDITSVRRADSWRKALANGRLSFVGNRLIDNTKASIRFDMEVGGFIADSEKRLFNGLIGDPVNAILDANQRQYADTIVGGAKIAQGKGN